VSSPPPTIRATHASESAVLRTIEVAAGRQFIAAGLADVADHPPLTTGEYDGYCHRGRSWVAVDDDDRPVAFLVAGLVDGNAHVDEVSVHPAHARQGIGRALIVHLAGWAAGCDLPALTLTTFEDVPWNAPYYVRCGFLRLDDDDLGPDLALIRGAERRRFTGLPPRVAMIRRL
jgi:GNAT superfamily N-acetyltransferase